jgi:hypothetical protein
MACIYHLLIKAAMDLERHWSKTARDEDDLTEALLASHRRNPWDWVSWTSGAAALAGAGTSFLHDLAEAKYLEQYGSPTTRQAARHAYDLTLSRINAGTPVYRAKRVLTDIAGTLEDALNAIRSGRPEEPGGLNPLKSRVVGLAGKAGLFGGLILSLVANRMAERQRYRQLHRALAQYLNRQDGV